VDFGVLIGVPHIWPQLGQYQWITNLAAINTCTSGEPHLIQSGGGGTGAEGVSGTRPRWWGVKPIPNHARRHWSRSGKALELRSYQRSEPSLIGYADGTFLSQPAIPVDSLIKARGVRMAAIAADAPSPRPVAGSTGESLPQRCLRLREHSRVLRISAYGAVARSRRIVARSQDIVRRSMEGTSGVRP